MTTSRALRRRVAAAAGAIGFALTVAACNAAPTASIRATNAASTADTSTTTSSTTAPTTPSTTAAPRETRGDDAHVRGTVASISASGFTVTGADGATTSVTTTSDTHFTKTVSDAATRTAVTLADVKVGDVVRVEGEKNADGSVTAEHVELGDRPHDEHRGVAGTVASVSASGFTLTTRDGTTVTVTTTDATKFHEEGDGSSAASLADVKVGDKVAVEGTKAADGSITADVVHIGEPPHADEHHDRQGPDGDGRRPSRGGPGGGQRTNGGR